MSVFRNLYRSIFTKTITIKTKKNSAYINRRLQQVFNYEKSLLTGSLIKGGFRAHFRGKFLSPGVFKPKVVGLVESSKEMEESTVEVIFYHGVVSLIFEILWVLLVFFSGLQTLAISTGIGVGIMLFSLFSILFFKMQFGDQCKVVIPYIEEIVKGSIKSN